MYDGKWIITGLIVLLALIASPWIYVSVSGATGKGPEPQPPPGGEKECIEGKEWMRSHHMELLNEWRYSVLREDKRTYVASDGKEYEINLTGTCLDCHSNKSEFCDRCHDYAGMKPNCWDCHVVPEGE